MSIPLPISFYSNNQYYLIPNYTLRESKNSYLADPVYRSDFSLTLDSIGTTLLAGLGPVDKLYFSKYTNNTTTQITTLTAPDTYFGSDQLFAIDSDMSKDRKKVFAIAGVGAIPGSAYIFDNSSDTVPSTRQTIKFAKTLRKIECSKDGAVFAVAGVMDNANVGAVWVYENLSPWASTQLFVQPNSSSPSHNFGQGLAFNDDGTRLFVSNTGISGNIYVFEKTPSWTLTYTISGSEPTTGLFGKDLVCDYSGNRLIVGVKSGIDIYTFSTSSWDVEKSFRYSYNGSNDTFGTIITTNYNGYIVAASDTNNSTLTFYKTAQGYISGQVLTGVAPSLNYTGDILATSLGSVNPSAVATPIYYYTI